MFQTQAFLSVQAGLCPPRRVVVESTAEHHRIITQIGKGASANVIWGLIVANIGALIIRRGSGGILYLYYNYNKEPQKPYSS